MSLPQEKHKKPTKSKPKEAVKYGFCIVAGPDDSCPVVMDTRTGYVNQGLLNQCARSAIRAGLIVPVRTEGGAS